MKYSLSALLLLPFLGSAQEPAPRPELAGRLASVGSDTLNNMITLWAESFRKVHPKVEVEIEGKGSTTAASALTSGRAQLGPMSREMRPAEFESFEKAKGYPPLKLRVALDALTIYVHKDNPVEEISLEELDAIWSKTRKRGHPEITKWGQLGLKGEWAEREISHHGGNSASGTYGFMKDAVLQGGEYKDTCMERPGGGPAIWGVLDDPAAMAYSGSGLQTSGVKKLRISPRRGEKAIAPEPSRVIDGTYPIRRFLYVYVDRPPGPDFSPLLREFCRFMFSKGGQEALLKDGFIPLSEAMIREELAALELEPVASFRPTPGVEGTLASCGSDTLNNLMALWAESWKTHRSSVKIGIEGKANGYPNWPEFAKGRIDLVPVSFPPRDSAIELFIDARGYEPTAIRVALDGLAIFVHEGNPLEEITLEQVDAIFSKNRKRGHPDIKVWGDLGLKGEWTDQPILLFGRNSASGTYGFFKEAALRRGDFKDSVREQPGSASVVLGVAENRFAIGYSGLGYHTKGVKKLRLAPKAGAKSVEAEPARIQDKTYPLRRPLFVYVDKPPDRRLRPAVHEFFRFVLSKEGQEMVVKDGFVPLSPAMLAAERRRLGPLEIEER